MNLNFSLRITCIYSWCWSSCQAARCSRTCAAWAASPSRTPSSTARRSCSRSSTCIIWRSCIAISSPRTCSSTPTATSRSPISASPSVSRAALGLSAAPPSTWRPRSFYPRFKQNSSIYFNLFHNYINMHGIPKLIINRD